LSARPFFFAHTSFLDLPVAERLSQSLLFIVRNLWLTAAKNFVTAQSRFRKTDPQNQLRSVDYSDLLRPSAKFTRLMTWGPYCTTASCSVPENSNGGPLPYSKPNPAQKRLLT
jgi:hypothetical protein